MSLMLRESTGGNDTAPPQPRSSALKWRLPRRKGDTLAAATTPPRHANIVGSGVTATDLGGFTNASTGDSVSTQAAAPGHLGSQTYATTNSGANLPTLGSSFGGLGVYSNAGDSYFHNASVGWAAWYTEALASAAVLFGTQGSGGVSMTPGALASGICVTIGVWAPETTKSILIAEHNVNEYAAGPTFVISGPLPTGLTLELLNDGSAGAMIVVPIASEALVSVAHDLQPIPTIRAIPDKFDETLAEVRGTLSDEEFLAAEHAIADARQTMASLHFASSPLIWVNDEGVAAVQWEAWPLGVLLVFTGDGTFTASVRDGHHKRYINGAREYAVSGGIPPDLSEAILALC